jgi:hypothetical protein
VTKPRHPFAFPEPGSLGYDEAGRWYLDTVRKIPGVLSRDRSPAEMLAQAFEVKSRLRLAAALALVEQEMAEEFLRKTAFASIDQLLEKSGGFGDEAERQALVRLITVTEMEKRAFAATVGEAIGMEVHNLPGTMVMTESGWQPKEEGGFPPGSPVNTPEGFKRIEEVRPGDLVLSAPADGSGPPQPKRVGRTFHREGRTLVNTSTPIPGKSNQYSPVTAAGPTLFWVEGRGWTRLDEIGRGEEVRSLQGAVGIGHCHPVYRTSRPGVGWVQEMGNVEEAYGSLFDYANHAPVEWKSPFYLEQEVWESEERFLRLAVHDLEVEDFHTYYVGGHWVRCA